MEKKKYKILKVDSDALEELSDENFNFFINCLGLKYKVMLEKGLYQEPLNILDIENNWGQEIVDLSVDNPYRTNYYILFDEHSDDLKLVFAIVRHEFGFFGKLKEMKLKELYVFGFDYAYGYERMVKYLNRIYKPYDKTIFKPFSYQRKEHMQMGLAEEIY